jgi:hypothetical protein
MIVIILCFLLTRPLSGLGVPNGSCRLHRGGSGVAGRVRRSDRRRMNLRPVDTVGWWLLSI